MKIIINSKEYSAIDSLGFSPETDLTNNSMPINEFEARIFTNDEISFGQWADLKDDQNNLWAHYWLRYAERIGRDDDHHTYIVKVIGQSPLAFLERVKLPAEYVNDTAYNLIGDVIDYVGNVGQTAEIIQDNVVATAFQGITITGFAPEQSARERLQWLLLVAGGYVLSYNYTTIHIEKIATSGASLIPLEKTFWKPSITFRDYVTKIKVHAYSYTQGTPSSTDEYVTDGTNYYIQTETVISVTNNNAPSGAPENVIEIEGCTLISQSLASSIITNLATYYFNRVEIDADVINNHAYHPGDLVSVYVDEDVIYSGYIDHIDYSFGLQARGRLHLIGAAGIETAALVIVYKWGDVQVASRTYNLPKGYSYSITTEFIDSTFDGHRYIFRPTTATVSGTLSANTTENVSVEIALDYYEDVDSRKSAYTSQMNQVISNMDSEYQAARKAIQKKYRGSSKKKKREKYLAQIEKSYTGLVLKANEAFGKLIDSVAETAHYLHVISVDDVHEVDQGVVQDTTEVEIDGSSASQPQDAQNTGYSSDVWQGGEQHTSYDIGGSGSSGGSGSGTGGSGSGGSGSGGQEEPTPEVQTSISAGAYMNNSTITSFTNSTVTTIGSSAFKNCTNLETVDFPSCEVIQLDAFASCKKLTTISFPVVQSINQGTFDGCNSLAYVDFPSATVIGDTAFQNCSRLLSVSFPKCQQIGNGAFFNCYSLQSAVFPSCTSVGRAAFQNCSSLSYASFPECLTIDSKAFSGCVRLAEVSIPKCTRIGSSAFQNCWRLSDVSLPLVSQIDPFAFAFCAGRSSSADPYTGITKIDAPELLSIGSNAFEYNYALSIFSAPKLQYIMNAAFYSCSALKELSFPNLIQMSWYAFEGCENLSKLYLMGSSVCSLGDSYGNVFKDTPMLTTGSVYVPSSMLAAYQTAMSWSDYSSRIVGV